MEKAHGQGNQAAAKSQGPETADAAELREGARKSRPMGEQPGAAAPEIGLGRKTRSEEVEDMNRVRAVGLAGPLIVALLRVFTGSFRSAPTFIESSSGFSSSWAWFGQL